LFEELGWEEAAEATKILGSSLIGLGSVLTAFGPLINQLGITVSKAGVKIASIGMTMPLAWGPFLLIVGAIAAAVAVLVVAFISLKKASPEY
jgi:hypothetical protein